VPGWRRAELVGCGMNLFKWARRSAGLLRRQENGETLNAALYNQPDKPEVDAPTGKLSSMLGPRGWASAPPLAFLYHHYLCS
jgi:hypothetical protein